MDEFTISTSEDRVRISLEEVYGFPDRTSHFGGYDVRGVVAIHCGIYHIRGPLWFSTGEVWQFYTQVQRAYDELAGEARFCSSERNMDFTLRFTTHGHWTLEGVYQEHLDIATRLLFEMESDQSYLVETLTQLRHLVAVYGDNRGLHQ